MKLLSLTILCLSVVAPTVAQADGKADLKKLQGDYKVVKLQRGGKDAPDELAKMKLKIKGNVFTMIVTRNGKEQSRPINAKLDASKSPKQVTLSQDGTARLEGIYKIEGKKLTFCMNRAGNGRPDKFESKEGSQWMLMVFERK